MVLQDILCKDLDALIYKLWIQHYIYLDEIEFENLLYRKILW